MIAPWYVELIQRERERAIVEHSRLAGLAARLRACCDPSLFERVARVLRRSSAAC